MVALGSRGLNYDGWEAVTPWTSLELSFELLAFFSKNARGKSRAGLHIPSINPFRAVAQLGRAPGSRRLPNKFTHAPPYALMRRHR